MSIGLRTHIVVCVSAALVQITAIDYNFLTKSNLDIMRLGAQVISGIGFLGMASIIKEGKTIVGLTTAASMWFIACVGLAVGSGLYIQAIMATLIIYFILLDVFKIDSKIKRKGHFCEVEIILDGVEDCNNKINGILEELNDSGLPVINTEIHKDEKNSIKILVTINSPEGKDTNKVVADLFKHEYIKKVEIN